MKLGAEHAVTHLISAYSGFMLSVFYFTAKHEPEKILIPETPAIMTGTLIATTLFIIAVTVSTELNEGSTR